MLAAGEYSGSLAVTATTSEAAPPRRPAGIRLALSMFRCLIVPPHETKIRLLVLQMRKAGLGTSRQLTRTQQGRGRLRSLQATPPSHARPAARAVWSLSCEWFLFCFTIRETSEDDEYLVMCENCKKLEFPCPAVEFFRAGPAPAVLWLLHCDASISRSRQKACGPKHQHLHRVAFDGRSCRRVAWVLARPPVSAGGESCSFLSPRLGSHSASGGYFKFLKSLLSLNSRSQVVLVTRVPDKRQNKNAHRGEDPSCGTSPGAFPNPFIFVFQHLLKSK